MKKRRKINKKKLMQFYKKSKSINMKKKLKKILSQC